MNVPTSNPVTALRPMIYAHSRLWYEFKQQSASRTERATWLWGQAREASLLAIRLGQENHPEYRAQTLFAGVVSRAAVLYALLGDRAEALAVGATWVNRIDTWSIVTQVHCWRFADWWRARPRKRAVRAECIGAFSSARSVALAEPDFAPLFTGLNDPRCN